MMVETKQEYSWINQRLKMRRLMEEHGLSEKEIAKHMNYAKASIVNRELRELALVEEYLEQYRGLAKTNYTLVGKGAQIFKEIAQRVTNKQGTSLELAKGVAFTMDPKEIRPGVKIAFLTAPQNVSIELIQRG